MTLEDAMWVYRNVGIRMSRELINDVIDTLGWHVRALQGQVKALSARNEELNKRLSETEVKTTS